MKRISTSFIFAYNVGFDVIFGDSPTKPALKDLKSSKIFRHLISRDTYFSDRFTILKFLFFPISFSMIILISSKNLGDNRIQKKYGKILAQVKHLPFVSLRKIYHVLIL